MGMRLTECAGRGGYRCDFRAVQIILLRAKPDPMPSSRAYGTKNKKRLNVKLRKALNLNGFLPKGVFAAFVHRAGI